MAKYVNRKMLFFSSFWNKQKISKNPKFMTYYDIIRKMYELYQSLENPNIEFKYLVNTTVFDNIRIIDIILAQYVYDFQKAQENHYKEINPYMLEKQYADKFYQNMDIFVNQLEREISMIW